MLESDIRFIVVRHGESDANQRQIISDKQVDHPLTERGIKQAEETAHNLMHEKIDLIISSTRQRAEQTGQIINVFHDAAVVLTDDLIERDYGIFSGIPKTEASIVMAKEGFDWLHIPESETAKELDRRVSRVVVMALKNHAGKSILISTHEDVIRSVFRVLESKTEAESMSLKIENSRPYIFDCSL